MLYAIRLRQPDKTITHHEVVFDTFDELEYGGFTIGSELEFGCSWTDIMGYTGWYNQTGKVL